MLIRILRASCFSLLILQLFLGFVQAHAASGSPEMMPQQIYAKNICGDANPGVRLLEGKESLQQVTGGGGFMVGGVEMNASSIDFNQSYFLLISMGSQRTGGYALRYQSAPLAVEGGIAQLAVEWIKPRPGNIVIQMLTQPCLVLAVPKGPFNTLIVKDQGGRLLGKVQVN